jgi:hypothetical protein
MGEMEKMEDLAQEDQMEAMQACDTSGVSLTKARQLT